MITIDKLSLFKASNLKVIFNTLNLCPSYASLLLLISKKFKGRLKSNNTITIKANRSNGVALMV